MSKIEVGDTVKIYNDLIAGEYYGYSRCTKDMTSYKGKIAKVISVDNNPKGYGYIVLDIDNIIYIYIYANGVRLLGRTNYRIILYLILYSLGYIGNVNWHSSSLGF